MSLLGKLIQGFINKLLNRTSEDHLINELDHFFPGFHAISLHTENMFKGSDRLCMVVELSMHGIEEKFFRIHLRRIKRFYDV